MFTQHCLTEMGKKDPDPPPRCVINDSFSMSCDVKSCQKTKRSLVLLTWLNATTARLFEGGNYQDFVMFTLFDGILGHGYLTPLFQPG